MNSYFWVTPCNLSFQTEYIFTCDKKNECCISSSLDEKEREKNIKLGIMWRHKIKGYSTNTTVLHKGGIMSRNIVWFQILWDTTILIFLGSRDVMSSGVLEIEDSIFAFFLLIIFFSKLHLSFPKIPMTKHHERYWNFCQVSHRIWNRL